MRNFNGKNASTKLASNVVSIDDQRKKQKQQKQEESFRSYLKSLKQEQLQYEANYLLNRIEDVVDKNQKDDLLLKSALLMDEIAHRVSNGSLSANINEFAQDIRSKADSSKSHRSDQQLH